MEVADKAHCFAMIELSLREIQLASLELLKTVAKICEENNLRYYLISGTLIGAVRHKGFIPWDDDLDIAMPRPDLDSLINHFEKSINNASTIKIMTPDNNMNYPYALPRVYDSNFLKKCEESSFCLEWCRNRR